MRYFSLVKPGILMGNSITLLGGFFLAMHGLQFEVMPLLWAWLGMSMVIASGCILNNFIDRDIDALMERTQRRPSVQGTVSLSVGLWLAMILVCCGLSILWYGANHLSSYLSGFGWFTYVVLYSLWLKRSSVLGTAIGGVAGAIPPVVGYVALAAKLDYQAVLLFCVLFLWQIPHSYAIALYREQDYRVARIPVLPLVYGHGVTRWCMLILAMCFCIAIVLPYCFGWLSVIYGAISTLIGVLWMVGAIRGFCLDDVGLWGRQMFLWSLLAINGWVLALLIG